jgi:hypothetical protein
MWTELPPKLESVPMEDAPEIAADVVAAIAQRIFGPHRDAVPSQCLQRPWRSQQGTHRAGDARYSPSHGSPTAWLAGSTRWTIIAVAVIASL